MSNRRNFWIKFIVVLLFVALLLAFALVRAKMARGQEPSCSQFVNEPISVSSTKKQVVVSAWCGGKLDLVSVSIATKQVEKLTDGEHSDGLPQWSPNSSQIAWIRFGEGPIGEIWVMESDGSGQRRVTTFQGALTHFIWSPDSRFIIFVSGVGDGGYGEIMAAEVNAGKVHRVTQDDMDQKSPVVSPDGTKIAFVAGSTPEIYVMEISSDMIKESDPMRLTRLSDGNDFPTYSDWPSWSPDSKQILFVSNRQMGGKKISNSDIWVMNADGSEQRKLVDLGSDEYYPKWSPDGKQISFVSNKNGNPDIFVVNSDGKTSLVQISSWTGDDGAETWFDDEGEFSLVFLSYRNQLGEQIFFADLNKSCIENLTGEDISSNTC